MNGFFVQKLKEMRSGIDKKEEETDIDIKVGNKPIFRKTESMPTISGISSSRTGQNRKVVMKGSTISRRSKVINDKNKDFSLQGSARNISRRNSMTKKYGKVKDDSSNNNKSQRISRRNSMTKKPMIPKFEPKRAVTNKRQFSYPYSHTMSGIFFAKNVYNRPTIFVEVIKMVLYHHFFMICNDEM